MTLEGLSYFGIYRMIARIRRNMPTVTARGYSGILCSAHAAFMSRLRSCVFNKARLAVWQRIKIRLIFPFALNRVVFYIPCRFANRTNQSIFKVPYTVPEILRTVFRFCGHGFCNAFRCIRKFCFCKCALMRVDSLRQFVDVLRIARGGKKN